MVGELGAAPRPSDPKSGVQKCCYTIPRYQNIHGSAGGSRTPRSPGYGPGEKPLLNHAWSRRRVTIPLPEVYKTPALPTWATPANITRHIFLLVSINSWLHINLLHVSKWHVLKDSNFNLLPPWKPCSKQQCFRTQLLQNCITYLLVLRFHLQLLHQTHIYGGAWGNWNLPRTVQMFSATAITNAP